MKILDYNLNQLRRSFGKKYENYVISRILHKVTDEADDIQFITQQYVKRPTGRALTDLYFPQFNLHIEIDEPAHTKFKDEDLAREMDIIDATVGHAFRRINIESIKGDLRLFNEKIDEIVQEILTLRKSINFVSWSPEDEFNEKRILASGILRVEDQPRFRTITAAANLLGQNVNGMQRSFFRSKKYLGYKFWFPKFYQNSLWDNKLLDDVGVLQQYGLEFGDLIQEKPLNLKDASRHFQKLIDEKDFRIVFPRFIDNLGIVVYRFMGIYVVDTEMSSVEGGMIYRRVSKEFKLK